MGGDALHRWLSDVGLDHLLDRLVAESVDLDVVGALTEEDLRELGVSLGDRRRFLNAAAQLEPADDAPTQTGAERTVERRQITVLFCDLVGSTELGNALDDESFARIVRSYSEACERAVVESGGQVAKFTGDGLMGYFGYPHATGDEARKAIEAGFVIQREIHALDETMPVSVAARVGIASGSAIVGEVINNQIDALGGTLNLAARIESRAEVGSVTVSPLTARLADGAFEFADAGTHELKGFSEPVQLFRAVRPLTIDPIRGSADPGSDACLGRDIELARIDELRRSTTDTVRLVRIEGEAGVGKSVLTAAAVRTARADGWPVWELACDEHEVDTPLHPIRRLLEALAGIDIRLDDTERRAALDRLATATERPRIATLGERLLGLGGDDDAGAADARTEIFDVAVSLMGERLADGPMMIVVDDLQWCDPTSAELLRLLTDTYPDAPMFVLCTRRTGTAAIAEALPEMEVIELEPFGPPAAAALIEAIVQHPVATVIVDDIWSRAGGVPLYVAELTRTLAEAGAFEPGAEALTIGDDDVPATLHDSLLARLDRLPNARDVAPLAAAIGLDFSLSLLEAAGGDVHDAIGELERANLVTITGDQASFRHALIRSVAYQRLVDDRRSRAHDRIGRALVDQFPERAASEPHVVARHLALGSEPIDGVRWYRDAARLHAKLSAHSEVISNVEAGLRVLDAAADEPRHDEELELQVLRAGTLRGTLGFAAEPVKDAYERCLHLAELTGDLDAMSTALNGMYSFFLVRDQYGEAGRVADQLLDTAERLGDLRRRVIANRAVGIVAFHVGEFARCQPHLDESIRLYHQGDFVDDAWLVGTDHATTAASFRAMNELVSGLGDAAATIGEAIDYARSIDHFLSWAQTVTYRGFLGVVGQDWHEAVDAGGELVAALADHTIPLMEASGRFWYSAGRFHIGEHREVDDMWSALEAWWATGANNYAGYLRSVIAEAELELGRPDVALATIDPAFDTIAANGERWALPECHRVRAVIRRELGDPGGADDDLADGKRIAQEQGATLWLERLASLSS